MTICGRYPMPLLPLDQMKAQMEPGQRQPPIGCQPLGRPPRAANRAPLAAVPVPQPTNIQATIGTDDVKKVAGCDAPGLPEELSTTVAPSSVSGRMSPRRLPCSSPQRPCPSPRRPATSPRTRRLPCSSPSRSVSSQHPCPSPSPSPKRPMTSPRTRMSDTLHGEHSIIRYPELQKRLNRSTPTSTRGGGSQRFTTPMLSPRNLAGDGYPRAGLGASDDCVRWLRHRHSAQCVEDVVDDMLVDAIDTSARAAEYNFARGALRNASYRDATRCATSMAGRTKPSKGWR